MRNYFIERFNLEKNELGETPLILGNLNENKSCLILNFLVFKHHD